MKSKILLSASVLSALIVLGSWTYSSLDDKDGLLIRLMMQSLSSSHYTNTEVDDTFSKEAFHLYLERLDFNKRFLLQEDVDELARYETKLDDEMAAGEYGMFNLSVDLINKRMKESQKYYKEFLSKPFDYTQEEDVNIDPEEIEYASDKAALKERWRKVLKYQTMSRLYSLETREDKEEDKEEAKEKKSFEQLEKDARKKVLENYDNSFTRMFKQEKKDWRSTYINTIANTFDPHTGYFPPKDKKNFDISISGQLEGIGARLQEQPDGYIKVSSVVPGGPAAKQGELEAEDLILKVGQNDDEPVDVVDMRLDDAVQLIRGKKGTKVKLTVRKPDETQKIVLIVRDVVNLEETYAKSAILDDGKSKRGIGYIHLPKFYANFNQRNGRSCAVDVGIELEKLKEEGVRGVVLDLRNNGGGSLSDVVDMAGLFIEKGPIVQVKSRNTSPRILADRDPEVQYDGPLVILVNSFSASASEILAAAMQDYRRAVIIGSPSTFGKGTVQRFFDLDDLVRGSTELKPLGAIKLTTQKFYRIDGGATQLKGVIPDIILPDTYTYLELGEKEQDHSMEWDEIPSVAYKPWVSTGVFIERAKKSSKERVANNPTFALINENAKRYKALRDRNDYPLNYESYKDLRVNQKAEADKYKDIEQEIPGFTVQNVKVDLPALEADTVKMKSNKKWLEDRTKDVYVFEAMQVLKDLK